MGLMGQGAPAPATRAGRAAQSAAAMSRGDYTVGWICALPVELAASVAMLDSVHDTIPTEPGDTNTYQCGRIGSHNVVMACLAEYGTGNAALVAGNIIRSFPRLQMLLMVGIGGGAPAVCPDLRLGDVVIGERVTRYWIKLTHDEDGFELKSVEQALRQELATAIAKLKALHELKPGSMVRHIEDMLVSNPDATQYGRPSHCPDRLFLPHYTHSETAKTCSDCDQSMLAERPARPNTHPKLHYGGIASGNFVVKDSARRDALSRKLRAACFEMEAGGFPDHFPYLAIRGICDYSDSHKSKEWQPYAAATAAAYAKELLVLSKDQPPIDVQGLGTDVDASQRAIHRERMMEILAFSEMDYRRQTVDKAWETTCKWILDHRDYRSWAGLDEDANDGGGGILWIEGHAGSGKSTLMKFLHQQAQAAPDRSARVVMSFFFHAQGGPLEKSVQGMYRSLIHQLLLAYPDLQMILNDPNLIPSHCDACPPLGGLKDILTAAVALLGGRPFVCFVDALDECDEGEVQRMVEHFEALDRTVRENSANHNFHVCFSSRPYPSIYLRQGVKLKLEEQNGHTRDIQIYIQHRLTPDSRLDLAKTQKEILDKANGIFLWVILVVDILNKDIRTGRVFMASHRLRRIPTNLSKLFADICTRDTTETNLRQFRLCLQWLLFSMTPLSPMELYYAIVSGLGKERRNDDEDDDDYGDDDDIPPDLSLKVSAQEAERYVISASRGLAQVDYMTVQVQFMHESVRDFLLKNDGAGVLWPDYLPQVRCRSHDDLKQCCHRYLGMVLESGEISRWIEEGLPQSGRHEKQRPLPDFAIVSGFMATDIPDTFPFFQYAFNRIIHHTNAAAEQLPQLDYIQDSFLRIWTWLLQSMNPSAESARHPEDALFNVFAWNGLSYLVAEWNQHDNRKGADRSQQVQALTKALETGKRDTARVILGLSRYSDKSTGQIGPGAPRPRPSADDGRPWKKSLPLSSPSLPSTGLHGQGSPAFHARHESWVGELDRAARAGEGERLQALIETGPRRPETDAALLSSLRHLGSLSNSNHNDPTASILRESAKKKVDGLPRLLSRAVKYDLADLALLFIEFGAEMEPSIQDKPQTQAEPDKQLERLDENSDSDTGSDSSSDSDSDNDYEGQNTPLAVAARHGSWTCITLLLRLGATKSADSVFDMACCESRDAIVRLLFERGCPLPDHAELLRRAIEADCEPRILRLLVTHGVGLDHRDEFGKSPLFWAASSSAADAVSFLLASGADPDARDYGGRNCLCAAIQLGTIAKLLIEKGANVHARDQDGRGPLSWCAGGWRQHEVMQVLLEHGAAVDEPDAAGRTPLIWAAMRGQYRCVRLLLRHGARGDVRDGEGRHALEYAMYSGNDERTVRLLERAIANEPMDTESTDSESMDDESSEYSDTSD